MLKRLDRSPLSGVTTSALHPHLQGNVTLYGCAIDPEGSRTCGIVIVAVKPPARDFNASAALATVDVAALLDVSAFRRAQPQSLCACGVE